jgi:asparagine synthase (glutamine-hydrolysing)
MNAAARWKQATILPSGLGTHPIVPKAHASLSFPQWTLLFEVEDPGVTRSLVEVRNPFLDLRVVEYLLAIPPFPWAFDKMILREAMVGRLPEKVRVRPKTPLRIDPLQNRLRQPECEWLNQIEWTEEVREYVNPKAFGKFAGTSAPVQPSSPIRAACLNFWLQSGRSVRYNLRAEVSNG